MRRTRIGSRATVAILVVAVGVGLSGLLVSCGSSGSGGGSSSKPDILVGAPVPQTGVMAADGKTMTESLEVAVSQINESGGLLGRKVKLKFYDVEDMSAEKMTAAGTQLIMQDKCSALITGYGLTDIDPIAYGKYPQPYLSFDGGGTFIDANKKSASVNKHMFMLGDEEKAYGAADFAFVSGLPYEFPNRKMVILAADAAWEKLTLKAMGDAATAAGWDVALYEVFPYGHREWSSQLAKIKQINPAVIAVVCLDPADVKTFVDQFRQDPTQSLLFCGYAAAIQDFATIVGENGEGIIGCASASVNPDEAGRDFTGAYEKMFGRTPGVSIAASTYDGVMMWAEAVKQAGDPDNYDKVNAAMHSMNYKGVQGTYVFTEFNYVSIGDDLGDTTLPVHWFQVRGGGLVDLQIGTKSVGTFEKPPWIH